MKKYILSTLFLLISIAVFAQNKNEEVIQGIVRITENESPEFIHVTLLNTNYGALSDKDGKFEFKAPAGEYTMAVFSLFTERKEFPVTVRKGIVNSVPEITLKSKKNYLDEVVVTGTRTARSLKNTPVLTKVISGTDIQESGATTVLEALESFVPGVVFTPNAMGDNINIAGLDNKYVLVLIDGERLVNERTENVNFTRLNTSDVKQIEIINGASSVLYGSNAIGAVINIITKDVDTPFQGNANVRYSNYNTWVGDLSTGFKVGNFSSKTSLSSKSSDGYSADRDDVASGISSSPYFDYTIAEVLKYKFNDKLDVELKGNMYRNEVWLLHKYQTRVDKNYTYGGKLNYTFSPAHILTFSGNSDNYRGDVVYKKSDRPIEYSNGSGYSTFRLLDVWDATKKVQLVSGTELNLEDTYSLNQFGDEPTERDARNWNIFSQGEFKTEMGLEALVGFRYTNHSEFGGYLSPKISLMYKLDGFRFRANVSNGYKAPTIKEMYMKYPHAIGGDVPFWIIGNTELIPEESWYKAISAEYLGSNINTSVTIYDNSIQNKIVSSQTYNPSEARTELRYENVEDAQITGVDVSLQWNFLKHFSLRTSYAFAYAVDKATDLRLMGNSKHNVTCNVVFKQKRLPFVSKNINCPYSLMLSGRYMSPRILSRSIEYDTDETTILNVNETLSGDYYVTGLVYNQQFPICKEMKGQLQLGINNLLNYVNDDTASNNPGRTYFVSLGVRF